MAGGDHVATSVGAGCILKPLADAARVVTMTVTRATGALSNRSARARRGSIDWKSIAGESLECRGDVSTTGKDARARSAESSVPASTLTR
jgi:hypothetical protein